jgi:hypothetical protein
MGLPLSEEMSEPHLETRLRRPISLSSLNIASLHKCVWGLARTLISDRIDISLHSLHPKHIIVPAHYVLHRLRILSHQPAMAFSSQYTRKPITDVFTNDTDINRRHCRRVVPMKVLILGLGRTGTACTFTHFPSPYLLIHTAN